MALRLLWAAFVSAGQATSLRSFSFVLLHSWQDMTVTILKLRPGKGSGSFFKPARS